MTAIRRLIAWLQARVTACSLWLYPIEQHIPADEAGELILRHLMRKSWFDKLTSWWVGKPVLNKMVYFAMAIFLAVLIGLAAGAIVGVTLTAFALSLFTHVLFFMHEQHRYAQARISAAEASATIVDLNASEQLFTNAAQRVDIVAHELGDQAQQMREQARRVDVEGQALNMQNQQLEGVVDAVQQESTQLAAQQSAVSESLRSLALNLQAHGQQLDRSRVQLKSVGDSAATFSQSVEAYQQSQRDFSQAANQFTLFVDERTAKRMEMKPQPTKREEADFMDFLDREIADNDAILEIRGLAGN